MAIYLPIWDIGKLIKYIGLCIWIGGICRESIFLSTHPIYSNRSHSSRYVLYSIVDHLLQLLRRCQSFCVRSTVIKIISSHRHNINATMKMMTSEQVVRSMENAWGVMSWNAVSVTMHRSRPACAWASVSVPAPRRRRQRSMPALDSSDTDGPHDDELLTACASHGCSQWHDIAASWLRTRSQSDTL